MECSRRLFPNRWWGSSELALEFLNLFAQSLRDWRNGLGLLEILYGLSNVFLVFFEPRQVHGNLLEAELIRLFAGGLLFIPAAEGELPDIARPNRVVLLLVIQPPKRKEDFVTVRIGAQAFPQKLFCLRDFIQVAGQ